MVLSPRLKAIAGLVKQGAVVADIGTDHGYIPVYLAENNISPRVIAADINEGPLNSARGYVEMKRLTDKIDLRLGSGLKVLNPHEVDTVIIAGMGGLLINDILNESNDIANTIDNFILQPMVSSDDLRRYLNANNFKITDERLAREENRIYEIIYAVHGKEEIEDDIFFEIPKRLIETKDPLLEDFLNKKITEIEKILRSIGNAPSARGQEKYNRLKIKYEKLKEVYKLL